MRRSDWSSRMYGVIDSHIHGEFSYGTRDCCTFVARVVDAMTDSKLADQIATLYTDEASAKSLIDQYGGLSSAVSHFLGDPETDKPIRGDVVLFDGGDGEAVGIWDGKQIVSVGESRLRVVHERKFIAVWHV